MRSKKLFTAICLLLIGVFSFPISSSAQVADWQWTTSGVVCSSVTTDVHGNVYVTGAFGSPVTLGTFDLTTPGGQAIFLAKYDSSGNVLWAKSTGGTSGGPGGQGNGVSTDAGGNVYVTGNFQSSFITFGADTVKNAGNGMNGFLAKYDSSGNVLWAKSAGGATWMDGNNSVSTDSGENVFVTGRFASSSITFDSITLTNTSSGNPDIFLVKYNSSGKALWAKSAGSGDGPNVGTFVSTDRSGNVYMTGYFKSSSITFGTITFTNTNIHGGDIFLAKYDAGGNALWAKATNSNYGGDIGYGVSTDTGGNVYMSGYFMSPSITFGTDTLTNADQSGRTPNVFLVKYDSSGNALWAKSAGGASPAGNSADDCFGVCADAGGDVYITGSFESDSITFGTITLTNGNLLSSDVFAVKYDASGNALWAKCSSHALGQSIAADAAGNAYIVGTGLFIAKVGSGSTAGVVESGYKERTGISSDATSGKFQILRSGLGSNAGQALGRELFNLRGETVSGSRYTDLEFIWRRNIQDK